jgi:hypothetical protein
MPRSVRVKEGQNFQDGTGLTVRVGEIDPNGRVHFSVIEDREIAGLGEMSYLAFVKRFTRIESAEDAAHALNVSAMLHFGVYESTVRSLNCCPTRFQSVIGSQFALKRKETQTFAYCAFQ